MYYVAGHSSDKSSKCEDLNGNNTESSEEKEPLLIVQVAKREDKNEPRDVALFMNPRLKYCLPPFVCNVYDNLLAITVSVKNVEANSIAHKFLEGNSGIHVLLTSMGSGFFPIHYSLCIKIRQDAVSGESFTVEPWDNNVVFTVRLNQHDDDGIAHYFAGIDDQFMEERSLTTAHSLKNKFQEITVINFVKFMHKVI